MKRTVQMACLWVCLGVMPTLSMADIDSVSGSMEEVLAPASVQVGDFESSLIRAFNEIQYYVLPMDVPVDITEPGTYDDPSEVTPGVIPGGTLVHSHLVHFDPVGEPDISRSGTITMADDILGIIINDTPLDDTDSVLGAPGTLYPFGESVRGIELNNVDCIIMMVDQRTISMTLKVSASVDQMRIVTAPEPGTLMVLGAGALFILRRARR